MELHLDSADGLNLLSPELLEDLARAPLTHAGAVRFLVTGNARCFSAGADLAVIAALEGAAAWRFARRGQATLDAIAGSPVPFIAAVEGSCLGGGLDLALACHTRLCGPDGYFGHHGARLGLVTGWGGTQRLPRLIGTGRVLQHLLAAEGWSAASACAQGLVQSVVPAEELLSAALSVPLRRSARWSDPD